jgi:hypothetical protein
MAIENKEELIKKAAVLEADALRFSKDKKHFEEQILTLTKENELLKEEIKSIKKSNQEISSNEHSLRILYEKLNFQLEEEKNKKTIFSKEKEAEHAALIKEKILANTSLQNQIENLKNDLNKLASLFDEYINAYQDQTKMLSVFVKNTQTVEKYLSQKIEQFNGGSKK